MSILTVIAIFVVGFLTLFAAYKYGGEYPVGRNIVYILVIVIFLLVLLNLAGLLPNINLNRKI